MRATLSRALAAVLACAFALPDASAEPRFDGYEIRVIRPRNFIKSGHLELTGGAGAIVNQSFIYTFLATGLLTYHFTESLAIEAQGAYGISADRQDKTHLDNTFGIKTILLRPETLANGRLVFTPSYGKFHLASQKIVYFDTHVTIGAGMTGVRYDYAYCDDPAKAPLEARDRIPTPPSPKSFQYPTGVIGIGQRYFIGEEASFRLGFEYQRYQAKKADAACAPEQAQEGDAGHDNLFLFMAWSYYL